MLDTDAVVVGSGPNGLAAAVFLARAGLRVRVHEAEPACGGGLRSAALTLPGFVHDVCSAVHPLAAASPAFRELRLERHGLRWVHPEVPLAHPLDDGTAVALRRSLEDTAEGLGEDAGAYRRLIAPLARQARALLDEVLQPLLRIPAHPWSLARFGLQAVRPATSLARSVFKGPRARALVAGCAAHSFLPLEHAFTGSFALVFAVAAHSVGWPVARGGSQRIADALLEELRVHGGEVVIGHRVSALEGLEPARAYLFDTSPATMAAIAGDRLPPGYRRRLLQFRRGPGIFKLDYALKGPVPWTAPECRGAGTLHLGGTLEEIAAGEAEVSRGGHPQRPFVLVAQQSVCDRTRAPEGQHTLWAYCHVPNGSTVDMTQRIEAQLERFAPGFKDLVLARAATRSRDVEAHNQNCAGGDIGGGAYDGLQFFARPTLSLDPYATPARELYLCSASTPPGAGVHGMCGLLAARSALRRSFGGRPR